MVVAGEILRELVTRELGVGDDAMHDSGLLEQLQIAVHGTLSQLGIDVEDLGDRDRAPGAQQDLHQRGAVRRGALAGPPESRRDGQLELV